VPNNILFLLAITESPTLDVGKKLLSAVTNPAKKFVVIDA